MLDYILLGGPAAETAADRIRAARKRLFLGGAVIG